MRVNDFPDRPTTTRILRLPLRRLCSTNKNKNQCRQRPNVLGSSEGMKVSLLCDNRIRTSGMGSLPTALRQTVAVDSMSINNQLIAFDFDWSMVDQDTDRYLFEVLAPDLRRKMKVLKDTMHWTDVVAQCLRELHARGGTREQIESAFATTPFHPAMVRIVSKLNEATAPNTTFICISNANNVFIDAVLEPQGLQDLFTEILTNPAQYTPSGLLELRRKIGPHDPPHHCKMGCELNMCKGNELDGFIKRHGIPFDRVIFVGDGTPDYCAAARLRKQDLLICRRYRGLEKRIQAPGGREGLQCQIEYWTGAWEVEEILEQL